MTAREIDDATEALGRLERDALAYSAGSGVAAAASRASVSVDADEVRRALIRLGEAEAALERR